MPENETEISPRLFHTRIYAMDVCLSSFFRAANPLYNEMNSEIPYQPPEEIDEKQYL